MLAAVVVDEVTWVLSTQQEWCVEERVQGNMGI